MKNPQTTIAPTFLTHIISAIGGATRFLIEVLFVADLHISPILSHFIPFSF